MKKVGQLMQELGFNKESSDSAKEAFIKYLIKQSTGVNVVTPSEKAAAQENPEKVLQFPAQLEFNFIDDEESTRKNA